MEGMQGLDEWVLAPGVQDTFSNFMRQMQQYKKSPSPSSRQYMYDMFGTTYYFEYFFLKDITYY